MARHIRRTDREITDAVEIDRLLEGGRSMTIAMCAEDEPYAVTLSYGYDPEARAAFFHAAPEGRKLDVIAANPRVCATVVHDLGYQKGECAHEYASVVLHGTMSVVTGAEERRTAMRTLVSSLEDADGARAVWEDDRLDDDATYERMTLLRLDVHEATAKRGR